MNNTPKKNQRSEAQLDNNINNIDNENIDEIVDEAVENAEARRELSENELDGIAGGSGPVGIHSV
jgi:hypothetical protein